MSKCPCIVLVLYSMFAQVVQQFSIVDLTNYTNTVAWLTQLLSYSSARQKFNKGLFVLKQPAVYIPF